MKNYLIISLLFLSVGFCQQKKTDKPNPMKGVKTQTVLQYDLEDKFGEFNEIFKGKTIYKYDSDGNMVEQLEYGKYESSISLLRKWIYKYDSNGKRLKDHVILKIIVSYQRNTSPNTIPMGIRLKSHTMIKMDRYVLK